MNTKVLSSLHDEVVVHKLLDKYRASTIDSIRIKKLMCYSSGKVNIVLDDLEVKTYYIDTQFTDVVEVSADYILCLLQDEPNINVSKR